MAVLQSHMNKVATQSFGKLQVARWYVWEVEFSELVCEEDLGRGRWNLKGRCSRAGGGRV